MRVYSIQALKRPGHMGYRLQSPKMIIPSAEPITMDESEITEAMWEDSMLIITPVESENEPALTEETVEAGEIETETPPAITEESKVETEPSFDKPSKRRRR